jgi:hypothetical protein
VKQNDLGEYEENAREKQNIQIYKIKHTLPVKPSHKDGKHQVPNSRGQQSKHMVSQWQKPYSPWNPGNKTSSSSNQGKSNQAPNSIKDTNSP